MRRAVGGNTYFYVEPGTGGWNMSIWWSLHLRREAASVPLARKLLAGAMDTAGVDPDTAFDLSLALTEACANAVEHGGASTAKYHVTVRLDEERCHVEVSDSGPGFRGRRGIPLRRTRLEAESGRGLGIISELSDHAQFRNRAGRGGAVVRFDKVVKWREGAPLAVA
ncbi:conserved hypothetical protein [Streptomyces sp. SPB074]|nr:conserved hypothetical protein [Streptomyces sp. SPB074]